MTGTVAILGFGRFGQTLAGLLRDRGFACRALDPALTPPRELRAAGPAELVRGAGFVVLAVPLAAMRPALAALAPHLDGSQIVLDVGSVKQGPAEAMAELLGPGQPWVATHPLFGPTSVSLGEPLRAVVCPGPHPGAVERVRELYRSIGCETLALAPDEHDRTMAYTHALTYFVTKGMLDIGVGLAMPFAPPSFRAMAQTIEAVRSDAGHLFTSIHRENPHAAEARRRLVAALEAVDAALLRAGEPVDIPPPLPADGSAAEPDPEAELSMIRAGIDACDLELIELLARRGGLARRAGLAKARLRRPVRDPDREAALLEDRRRRAAELGLDDPELVEQIFEAVLRLSRSLQGDRT